MADFGAVPKGERFGLVPAFPSYDPSIKPGPKALYASLCTNASAKGHLWRSLNKLAEEFSVSRRQIQRWLNDLEAAGLVVRLTERGGRPKIMVIRDPQGRDWARRINLKNTVSRRSVAVPHGREGARRKKAKTETPMSQEPDTSVPKAETPMSPKHDLLNKTTLTDEEARQEGVGGARVPYNRGSYGLKQARKNEKARAVQEALNQFADRVGWEELMGMDTCTLMDQLMALHPGEFSVRELELALKQS